MKRLVPITFLLLLGFSAPSLATLALTVGTNGILSASPIKLTLNNGDFDASVDKGAGNYNYSLPEVAALREKGLVADNPGLVFHVINENNVPWTFYVGPGTFISDEGQTLLPESLAQFLVVFAGVYDVNNKVFIGSNTNAIIKSDILTTSFVNFDSEVPAYTSGAIDTNHTTLGQAFGFSDGTQIQVQMALNLSPLQPAGTYNGTITFKVKQ